MLGFTPSDGSTIPAGDLGEIFNVPLTDVVCVTATQTLLATMNLSAGNWMVYGNVTFDADSSNYPSCLYTLGGISTTNPAQDSPQYQVYHQGGSFSYPLTVLVNRPFNSIMPSTLYLVGATSFSGGTNWRFKAADSYFFAVRIG
jgi:hypothetical protein